MIVEKPTHITLNYVDGGAEKIPIHEYKSGNTVFKDNQRPILEGIPIEFNGKKICSFQIHRSNE